MYLSTAIFDIQPCSGRYILRSGTSKRHARNKYRVHLPIIALYIFLQTVILR